MATTEILNFAQGGGANVDSQATYLADAQRTIGNQPGIARDSFVNKVLLQVSAVSAGVAKFLADFQGTNITDQLTPAQYETAILAALNATGVFTTQAPGTNTTQAATTAFVGAAVATAIAPGSVDWFPATGAPTGYVKANGAVLSRASYPNLWTFANASGNIVSDATWLAGAFGSFSSGDGSTTFRVPDMRGMHPRAWDDGRGFDSGRAIGSFQAAALLSHNHTATVTDPTHTHNTTITQFQGVGGADNSNYGASSGTLINTAAAATGISVSIAATGSASENRVANVALLACIKY